MLIQDGCLERVENADIIDGVFVIPDRVQEIPDWAFQKCRSPRKIVFSARVSYSAGFYWPFAHCRQLEHIEVDERNPVFCAEGGILFDREKTNLFCCPMKWSGSRCRIPDTVTLIDHCAFQGCSALTEVMIPPAVRFIGDWAFDGCAGLRQIQLPVGLDRLGDCAFRRCTSLSEVVVPEGVKFIGMEAFKGCGSLERIFLPSTVQWMGQDAFVGCTSLGQDSRSAIELIQAKMEEFYV